MKKGILFFDVDGTLIDSDSGKMVPDKEVMQAIQKVRQNGYFCIVSSGRNMTGLEVLRNTGFDGFVFSDGAGIVIEGEEPEIIAFEHDFISALLKELVVTYRCDVNACCENGSFANEKMYDRWKGFFDESVDERKIRKLYSELNIQTLDMWKNEKILETDIYFPDRSTKEKWMQEKPEEIEFMDMDGDYGEITVKGVTKASGCLRMCEKLGISIDDCYAFGDSMNDEAMLKECGKAIVMGNGDERLKEEADYVTGRIDEGGLIQAFRHYALL